MPAPPDSTAQSIHSIDKSDALFQVKLLAALRSGDPAALHPFLAEIGKSKSARAGSGDEHANGDLAALTLHLAIRCASYETIIILLGHRSISPNAPYPADTLVSPLHLAASLGRSDVVSLLLEQDEIDDSVKDAQGRSVPDVATREVKEIIQEWRDDLQSKYLILLHAYVTSPHPNPPSDALLSLLASPRIHAIDLSALEQQTGTSLLHEAARRSDLRLIELAIRGGADVFVRDRRGRGVNEGEKGHSKEHERVKVFLRQFTNRDTTLIDTTATEPPSMKGYLNKYTNVARGYNVRWFVLKDGVLSYYRHQDDENLAGRGSISMRTAKLKASTSDRLRFEVASTPTRSGSSPQKWYMRAEHPVEVARWTQAISRSIDWYTHSPASTTGPSVTATGTITPVRPTPSRSSLQMTTSMSGGSDAGSIRAGHASDTRSIYASTWRSPRKKTKRFSRKGSQHDKSPSRESFESKSTVADESGMDGGDTLVADKDDAASVDSSRGSERSSADHPPHQSQFKLHENSTQTQIELTTQLLASLVLAPSPGSSPNPSRSARAAEIKTALQSSFELVRSMVSDYATMAREREEWYQRRYEREKEKTAMWEDSLGLVVGESEGLERDLLRLREEKKHMRRALRASMIMVDESNSQTIRASKKPDRALPSAPEVVGAPDSMSSAAVSPAPPSVIVSSPPQEFGVLPQTDIPSTQASAAYAEARKHAQKDEDDDEDDDDVDEFFDAIDTGTVPNMVITAPLMSPPLIDSAVQQMVSFEQYEGYGKPRDRLPISNDNRPPVSLWAVLKGSIGKDLTKISFPVFFNEPTSMLQRMAEDMEFTECLDAAAAESDPHKRIAFVAAFAMSNYSSTIGRIAKPFNPLLGETFEYVRLDRQYRYVSEQVSHHPPISACWSESPSWNYYGEVDAKNKFMGKSFEIRPTGVAHADLKIPVEFVEKTEHASKYPRITSKVAQGKVLEHYSWKKVTTNVSGFIVGSPTIDHYGDMTVVNHRTGDRCVLSFKPRGWRASTACEIKGYVMDAGGRVTWEIAGRWSNQLVARRAGSGSGDLLPDVSLRGRGGAVSPGEHPECVLLWRNTEKPTMPFNLTPFAITLNDCPKDTLAPYLPPTDCRLRPDQRAFENGEYERANGLKTDLEEYQRGTRKRREAGELLPHKPRWFEATTETDTGERVWAPFKTNDMLDYWSQREKVWKSKGKDSWDNVDKIFGDIQ